MGSVHRLPAAAGERQRQRPAVRGADLILFIGDSLAVGTPLAAVVHERVVKRAEGGVASAEGVRRFLLPLAGARVVVVSLGSNDTQPAEVARAVRKTRRRTKGRCLLWIEVAAVPRAGAINRAIRRQHVMTIPWHSKTLHPSPAGYERRARLIRRHVRRRC